jgi:transcriptional regulator with XRE-family HTH domain
LFKIFFMPELKEFLTEVREKHGNKAQVAKKLGISPQLLGQYEKGRQNPKVDFFDKWKEVYNQDLRLMMIETNVSHGTEKHTPAMKSTSNKEMSRSAKETFFEDLIERNDTYFIAPRAIFTDYKIVPDKIIDVIISSNENEKKALEKSKDLEIASLVKKYELIIEGQDHKIKRLEKENEDLKSKVPAQQQ